jgi:toxin CcdB
LARFDLYRVDDWRVPLMVDVQSDHLGEIASRVIIPLRRVSTVIEVALPRLKPVLRIEDQDYILVTTDLGAQPLHWLGQPVGNIAKHRDTITAAMDFLFQGY